MNEYSSSQVFVLVLAFGAGLALGAFYFTVLWRTVRQLPETRSPVRLMLGGFVLRMAVVLPVFYFVMGGHWERLTAAFCGFIAMRIILTRYLGQKETA